MGNKKKNKKWLAIVISLFFIVAVYLGYEGFRTYSALNKLQSKEKVSSLNEVKQETEKINILIAGIDSGKFAGGTYRKDRGRTDTLMVASIDTVNKNVKILSIPRDSRVNIPGKGSDKINHAHAYGGMDLTVRTVQGLLDVPIHHYIRVNFEAFIALVDELGSVTVEIKPSDLQGVINLDPNVPLKPGIHKLDSEHAFQFVRIRNSDIGRVERQQRFIKALMKESLKVENIFKLTGMIEAVAPHLDTNMSISEMAKLASEVKGFKAESLETEMLPGKGGYIKGVSYWIVSEEKKKEISDRYFK